MDSLGNDFDALLTRGALWALVAAGMWSLVVVAAVAVEARTRNSSACGPHLAERLGCPRVVRAWLLAAFVALFATVAPAHANDAGPGPGSRRAGPAVVDGLPLPDRATGRVLGSSGTVRVTVRPGDSLWRIARRQLPDDAPDREVAAAVDALFAANSSVIGPDPDRLLPGQRLRVDVLTSFPDPTTTTTEEP